MKKEFGRLLEGCLPSDHSRQVTPEYYVELLLKQNYNMRFVMDLGCGAGNSLDYFCEKSQTITWVGVDIQESPEADFRARTDAKFVSYDGIRLPFGQASFDLVYCKQVLEHVRYPEVLMREVHRILKPGGYLVGSTSHLEPYHSHSMWNYTPYGFRVLAEAAGLELLEVRPGIDALTLIIRRAIGAPRLFQRWFSRESPINLAISFVCRFAGIKGIRANLIKLLFCGHFCFMARKVERY